jgi:hypothetical protein
VVLMGKQTTAFTQCKPTGTRAAYNQLSATSLSAQLRHAVQPPQPAVTLWQLLANDAAVLAVVKGGQGLQLHTGQARQTATGVAQGACHLPSKQATCECNHGSFRPHLAKHAEAAAG